MWQILGSFVESKFSVSEVQLMLMQQLFIQQLSMQQLFMQQPIPIYSVPFACKTPDFPTLRTFGSSELPIADRRFRFYPISGRPWKWVDFGMNVNGLVGNYPTIPVGALRLWSSQWQGLQPEPKKWNWETLDAEVEKAKGVPIVLVLGTTARWASVRPDEENVPWPDRPGTTAPPKRIEDWEKYVAAVAQRYRGKVRAYELWNEPTSAWFWAGSPEELAKLTRSAARVLRSIDPKAIILSPSGTQTQDKYRDYIAWFEEFARAGGMEGVDAVAWHLYTDGAPEEKLLRDVLKVREMMGRLGLGDRELWITEGGYLKAAGSPDPINAEQAVALLSRYLLVGMTQGMDSFYYYAWNEAADNAFAFRGDGVMPVARAWSRVGEWITQGEAIGVAKSLDGIWAVKVKRDGGEGYIVWRGKGKMRLRVPLGWKIDRVMDLNGAVEKVEGNVVVDEFPRFLLGG